MLNKNQNQGGSNNGDRLVYHIDGDLSNLAWN